MPGCLPPVAVLQRQHDLARPPRERHGRDDAVGALTWSSAEHGESAGAANGSTGLVTSGTSGLEEHVVIVTKGCHNVLLVVTVHQMPPTTRFLPGDRVAERLLRCTFGLALFGVGIAMLLDANLGAAPWDVFHTGVSELTGISVGNIVILTGIVLLALWVPLRERPGLGTILNAIEIGLVVDLALPRTGARRVAVPPRTDGRRRGGDRRRIGLLHRCGARPRSHGTG